MPRIFSLSATCGWLAAGLLVSSVLGQAPKEPAKSAGPRLGEERTETYFIGLVVSARKGGGALSGVKATLPMPIDWPEQTVKVLHESKSKHVRRVEYALVGEGGAKQMRIRWPDVPEDEKASTVLTVKIDRREILPPEDPSQFVIPEKLDPKLNIHLLPSPYIESNDEKFQSLGKEVVNGKSSAWERVEAIYDWVRGHITYEEGDIKPALEALKDGKGDAEELTSLFIALCRANKIPARMVWVPRHCYPEFYLLDRDGKGHWFPCELKGRGSFGQIAEFRPILQKGDNFTVPEKLNRRQRYVSEFLSVKSGRPRAEFVRENVKDQERE